MANYFQNIPIFLFLILALIIVCLETQSTQGRQIKPVKEHDIEYVQMQITGLQIPARKLEQQQEKMIFPSESREPTATGNSPGIGHSHVGGKDNMGTMKMQEFSTTAAGQADGDDVKEPAGHSPGIGHSHVGERDKIRGRKMELGLATTGGKDSIKGPGHSPGIGHSAVNLN